jgi:parallel beta-helix repeat protein
LKKASVLILIVILGFSSFQFPLVGLAPSEASSLGWSKTFASARRNDVNWVKLASSSPQTWIVDDDGPADFRTIQESINAANEGDTILVRNGTYHEHVNVPKSLSIIGDGINSTVIDGGGGGIVVYVIANDVLIKGFEVKSGLFGFFVDHSDNCVLSDNSVTGVTDNFAVYVSYSQNCTIKRNVVGPNSASGILVTNSMGFTISENHAFDNSGYGVNANASFNGVISLNDAVHNSYDGIGLGRGCSNCTVFGNNVANNLMWGIWLESDSFGNLIYDNSITANGRQASVTLANRWDDGYPSGGNYWSDYSGEDQFWGPSQDQRDCDGIGDTAYFIGLNNFDNYPLMNPWTPPDVAALRISSTKMVVGQGFSSEVTLVLQNQGNKIEELNATFYANDTYFGNQTFMLKGDNYTTYSMDWYLGSLVKGNYSLSVRIKPLDGETDLEDNSKSSNWVFISVPGDLDCDKTVNIYDAILLAGCFNVSPAWSRWNPNADINNDGIVDIYDVLILAANYGKSWT